ncbi:hypothetical protein [Nocardioides panacisoli]|uniref:Uncharacterized protein n=1 Tax=Nocardioides panacisoli TaxID=627624 RepID=A0ABP7HXN7_9ACTN
MTDSYDAPVAPGSPPPTAPPPAVPPLAAPARRGVPMAVRHVLSVVVAVVVAPVALLVFDYGAEEYTVQRTAYFDEAHTGKGLVLVAVGALLLLLVAALGRVSGLGPVLAGLLYGVAPFLWFHLDVSSFYSTARDLPSTHLWFVAAVYEFPLVAALLIGAGLAGRWARPRV